MKTQNEPQQTCKHCDYIGPYSDFIWIKGRKKPTTVCKACHRQRDKVSQAQRKAIMRRELGIEVKVEREKKHDVPHEEHCKDCHLYRVTTSWHYPSCYYACVRREDLD